MKTSHNEENQVILSLKLPLNENISILDKLFLNCADVTSRQFTIGRTSQVDIYLSYVDNMIDRTLLEQNIIRSLLFQMDEMPSQNQFDYIRDHALPTIDMKETNSYEDVTQAIMSGDVALLVDGFPKALLLSLKDFPSRGVPSVETEVTIKGAKDSFTESVAVNKVLIRRRIKDTHLKFENLQIGQRSHTDISIAYMDGIVRENLVTEIKERLNSFTIDGIFDVGMLEQLTETTWYSPFPQFQSTERPDKASSALLEGRVVLIVDNSPMVLILPVTMAAFFQAADDYYNRWGIVSLIRVLRYIGAVLAIGLPGLYLAIVNYQPELIPTSLALSFAAARIGVPFSILLEILIMGLAFEMLSEAGVRLPAPMGNTIGIVGGLIIGDAAVSANLVSPMVVIIVAFTAIASFIVPNETFASAFRITRYLVTFLSAWLGLYGFVVGMVLVLIHLAGLKSFGIPYLVPFVATRYGGENPLSDTILKFPIFKLRQRPLYAKSGEKVRLTKNQTQQFNEKENNRKEEAGE